jgi:hypothetical protein
MSSIPIFESDDVEDMEPWELSDALISRTLVAKKTDISINGQYKIDYQEILRDVEEGKITFPISAQELDRRNRMFLRNRLRKGQRNLEASNGTSFHDTSSTREQSIAPAYDASSNSAILEDL